MTDVMVLAGEASGDLHGARMVEALRNQCIDNQGTRIQFRGMGGDKLRAAGVDLLVDCKNIAVIGLTEVLKHWPEIKRALKTIEAAITSKPPDLLILIDYVEFNLRMAAVAKRHGVKVLFYVSPQIWAWRPERIHKIGELVDMMAVIFPFEVKFYERANIPVRYVGHPLSGHVSTACTRDNFSAELKIPADNRIVGLLPGSRANEINYILPVLLETAVKLNKKRSDLSFVLPVAPTLSSTRIKKIVDKHKLKNLYLLEGRAFDVMSCADSIAIASGTATLEAAMLGVPMAIVYKVSPFSWLWMKRKLQINYVGLANIVAERQIVPEFIQGNCRADLIAAEIQKQLDDEAYSQQMCQAQAATRSLLGSKNAAHEVATLAVEMLGAPATNSVKP